MPRWAWIAGAVALLLLLAGGGTVAAIVYDRRKMAELLRDAAQRHGVDPDVAEAIGVIESNLDPTAVNNTGNDAARGGAFGATQITLKTAAAYGFTGTGDDLLNSPETQAELTATILAANPSSDPQDAAAWWNAGKRSVDDLPRAGTAYLQYLPRFNAALAQVREESNA